MKIRRIVIILSLMISTLVLGGCMYKESQISDTTLILSKDKQLQAFVFSDFDKDYYNIDELHEMAQGEIDDYNVDHGEEYILLNGLERQDSKVIMNIRFVRAEDYSTYMATTFHMGDVKDAEVYGCDDSTVLYDTKNNQETMIETVKTMEGLFLIRLTESMNIHLPSSILYYSEGVTCDNMNREAKVLIPQSGYSIIIIKNE